MSDIINSAVTIIRAEEKHLSEIIDVTKEAFRVYQGELGSATATTPALLETPEDVIKDIKHNNVNIALLNGKIIGSIRYEMLSPDIAYIYRFGVLNDSAGLGTGTLLLEKTIEECLLKGAAVIALHTNSKYYKLARYYYGKEFFVHSTTTGKGYIRALFIKELKKNVEQVDLTPAVNH